jgi:signal transduction histidine kinase
MMLGNRKKEIEALKQKLALLKAENEQLKKSMQIDKLESSPFLNRYILLKILEIYDIGILIKSSDDENLWLSDNARDILGCKNEQSFTLDTFKSIIIPEDRIILEKALIDIRTRGINASNLEFKISRNEGDGREFRIISVQITVFDASQTNDGKALMLGCIKDITRQDKVKRDLIRSKEKAEESERLKNFLLTNISHEIRTPMNSIIGFSELLNIGNLPYNKRLEYVRTIKNQGIILLKMIDDLAELTRMETGKVTIRKSPCNIALLINEIISVFNQYKLAQNKEHLEIKVNFPENRDLVIYTDPGRLQQLLSALVNNSVKFTEKGWVELGYKLLGDQRIEFYVKDTGIGLSRELQKKIFGRIAEEDTLTGKPEGAGLGLTIAKNLIRLMNGKIWVESEIGQGSTFFLTIPYEEVPETYHKISPEEEFLIPSYTWKDKVILVVEDDEVNFKFLEAVLHDTSAQVLHANSGVQAVELCQTITKIDLVLMDIKMPEMDGYEATRRIREFNLKVPIIAQTAFFLENELKKCKEAGCNDQITKPINIKEFLEKVDVFLKEQ